MDAMKLDGVQSLPLEFNSYAETVISMLRDRSSGLTDAKLLKHLQNVWVHRDIAIPGFFKWLQENLDKEDFFLQPWLTFEVMGKTSMKGGYLVTAHHLTGNHRMQPDTSVPVCA
ncbi:unnamed protein product [Ectocarpus sp. CCAP 1310/34]|nr:unnamed protein product [Ectocarpus sp. CCAP 1310/34]